MSNEARRARVRACDLCGTQVQSASWARHAQSNRHRAELRASALAARGFERLSHHAQWVVDALRRAGVEVELGPSLTMQSEAAVPWVPTEMAVVLFTACGVELKWLPDAEERALLDRTLAQATAPGMREALRAALALGGWAAALDVLVAHYIRRRADAAADG